MKILRLFSNTAVLFGFTALLLVGAGCQKEAPKTEAAASSGSKPGVTVSAEKNSFQEVTKQLDPGGSFYLYLGTEQWLTGLSQKIAGWRALAQGLPGVDASDRDNVGRVFDVVTHLVQNSGVEDVSGLGVSSIAREPGFYRSKFVLHHYPGKGSGYLWTLFGKSPHALDGLDLLPASTAVASFSDLDLPMLWSVVEKELAQSGIPGAQDKLKEALADFEKQSGLNWNKLLASLGGEYGLVITLDETKKITVPLGPGSQLEVPEPGILLVLKVKDDLIFDRVEAVLTETKMPVTKVDQNGLRMRTVAVPVPLPISLRPSIARSGDYLMVATTDTLIQDALAVKSGKQPGLKATDEFKKLSQDMPAQGNRFGFVSQKFGRTFKQIQTQILQKQLANNPSQAGLMNKLTGLSPEQYSFAVSANSEEGWVVTANGNQNASKVLMLPAVGVSAVAAGMLLPALAKAKEKAQTINCVNNLKQIGLAARLWPGDHNDTLPKDFLSMKEELSTPRILNCPNSKGPQVTTWEEVAAGKGSYQLLAPGISESGDPMTVIALCPIHGNVVLLDGSVQQLGPSYRQRLKVVDGRTVLTDGRALMIR